MKAFLGILALMFLANPALAADAPKAAAPACKSIATVYGKDICEKDIGLTEEGEMQLQAYAIKSKQDPAVAKTNILRTNLFSTVWELGLDQKFGVGSYNATDKEIAAYLKLFRSAMKEQYGFDKELAALVKTQLEKYKYPTETQQQLSKLGVQKQKSAEAYEKRKDMPADVKAKIDNAETKLAEGMIKGWKVKKLLFGAYGGGVTISEMEMEPVDAYRAFLAEIKKSGAPVIHDDKYKDVFTTMEEYLKKERPYVPADAPEIKAYFEAPGWIYSSGVGKKIFDQIKTSILAMPHDDAVAKAPKDAPKKEDKKK